MKKYLTKHEYSKHIKYTLEKNKLDKSFVTIRVYYKGIIEGDLSTVLELNQTRIRFYLMKCEKLLKIIHKG